MLLNCFTVYCQNEAHEFSSTGWQIKNDSVLLPINDIRIANNKLIEGKYYRKIYNEQCIIIDLKDAYILQQDSIILNMQNRIIKTTNLIINYKMNIIKNIKEKL